MLSLWLKLFASNIYKPKSKLVYKLKKKKTQTKKYVTYSCFLSALLTELFYSEQQSPEMAWQDREPVIPREKLYLCMYAFESPCSPGRRKPLTLLGSYFPSSKQWKWVVEDAETTINYWICFKRRRVKIYMIIKQNTVLQCQFKWSIIENPDFVWTHLPETSHHTFTW